MTKPTFSSSTRIVGGVLALTNVLSFSLGLSVAGRSLVHRLERRPKEIAPVAAAASLSSVLFGRQAAPKNPLPIEGKGMWIYQFDKVAGGDPHRIVRLATQRGLTHIYVR